MDLRNSQTTNVYKGIQLLNEHNYQLWEAKTKAYLLSEGVFRLAVLGNPVLPQEDNFAAWEAANDRAFGILIRLLSDPLVQICKDLPNAKSVWDRLKQRFQAEAPQLQLLYYDELSSIKMMRGESVSRYLSRAIGLQQSCVNAGRQVTDTEVIHYVLRGITRTDLQQTITCLRCRADLTIAELERHLLFAVHETPRKSKYFEFASILMIIIQVLVTTSTPLTQRYTKQNHKNNQALIIEANEQQTEVTTDLLLAVPGVAEMGIPRTNATKNNVT